MITISRKDYTFLEWLDVSFDGKLAAILNRSGAASLTVCPECRVDDFTHVEGCSLSNIDIPAEIEWLRQVDY